MMKNRRLSLRLLAPLSLLLIGFVSACDKKGTNSEQPATEEVATVTETSANSPGTAQEAQTASDAQYFNLVALTDLKEIEVGKLAQKKRPKTATGTFGEMLEKDHKKSTEELKPLAAKNGVELPTALDENGRTKKSSLDALEGAAFDKQFAKMMVDGHTRAIAMMREISQNAVDSNFKSWASAKIPVLESHLKHAQMLQNEVGQK